MVEQPNLGGSGGFARTMYESFTASDATHHILLDDDIQLEADSILRASGVRRVRSQPVLVGGQMLALQDRSVLHTMGEIVDRSPFFWRNAPNTEYFHDFGEESLRESKDLHRRIDVDYNGWWMCLIPRAVFERGRDAAAGLHQVGRRGVRPALLRGRVPDGRRCPGAAIWHLSWGDKDDASDWQAYFHIRNRLIAAALHSPHSPGGRMFQDMLKHDLRFLITLQYSTVELHQLAYRDFIAGTRSALRGDARLGRSGAQHPGHAPGRPGADVVGGPPACPR